MNNAPTLRFEGFTEPWEHRKLGELVDSFEYGLNAAAADFDGVNKYLRITDIDDNTREFRTDDLTTPQADLAASADYLLKEGDLLFARTGASVGKTYLYSPFDGRVYFAGFLIRAHVGVDADSEFVFQSTLTERYRKYIAITSQRSGQPGVNAQEYAKFEIPLPSLPEQQEIGSLLRGMDNLITLYQHKCDRLKHLKQAMLQQMFPKPGEVLPALRFEGFTEPWEQRRLGDCGTTYGGLSGKTKEDFGHGDANFVPYTNVFENPITDTARLEAVEIDPEQNEVRFGDALFTVSSETPEEVGMASVWLSDKRNVYLNSFCFGYRQDGSFDSFYLAYMLRSASVRADLTLLAQGISRFNISKNKVMDIKVPCPEVEEQRAVGAFFTSLDNLIALQQCKCNRLKHLKQAMLQRVFV